MGENLVNHTVLVVDDEEDLRELLREALELNGYTVVTAEDGRSALDAIDRIEHLCLVLLDLLMPGMNGWDLFKELKSRPALAEVPIVVHSSAPVATVPVGATRVLQKPLQLERLLPIVQEYCAH